jgi:hypothetical protein
MVDIVLREGIHPQTGPGTITAADNGATVIDNGAANFSEGDGASRIAYRYNGKE